MILFICGDIYISALQYKLHLKAELAILSLKLETIFNSEGNMLLSPPLTQLRSQTFEYNMLRFSLIIILSFTNLLSDVVERISIHSSTHQTLEQDYEYRYPEGWNETIYSLTK